MKVLLSPSLEAASALPKEQSFQSAHKEGSECLCRASSSDVIGQESVKTDSQQRFLIEVLVAMDVSTPMLPLATALIDL